MSKHICPKCHKAKKTSAYRAHVKKCIPSVKNLYFLSVTKSGSFHKEETPSNQASKKV